MKEGVRLTKVYGTSEFHYSLMYDFRVYKCFNMVDEIILSITIEISIVTKLN